MEAKQLLSAVADTVIEKATRVEVEIYNPRWWEKMAIRLRLMKSKRIFYIKPATLGTMIRVSQLLLNVDLSHYQSGSDTVLSATYKVLEKHGDVISEAFAVAVANSKAGPSSRLIAFMKHNLTAKDLAVVSNVILSHLNIVPFMNTIISMRGGMSLLKTGEKIASGEPSEA